MSLDAGGGPREVGPVLVEVDGVGHGTPLVAEQLSSMLWRDDANGMGREAVTECFDRDLGQIRHLQD